MCGCRHLLHFAIRLIYKIPHRGSAFPNCRIDAEINKIEHARISRASIASCARTHRFLYKIVIICVRACVCILFKCVQCAQTRLIAQRRDATTSLARTQRARAVCASVRPLLGTRMRHTRNTPIVRTHARFAYKVYYSSSALDLSAPNLYV